ncbi:hypothetical protein LSUE1_G003226 [Lachnellula suecica]|uniref:Uncharacterized protein n=1 Tax=Lachnellula suecica TaxID=602035 RepID=A0A8T9C4I7_9HELO|nr:hypothetical protein LSUE1_G003226 [Lachnellula suecica]
MDSTPDCNWYSAPEIVPGTGQNHVEKEAYSSLEPVHPNDISKAPPYPGFSPEGPTKRICGLAPRTFWIVLSISAIGILGAAVGGGVGGSLASRSHERVDAYLNECAAGLSYYNGRDRADIDTISRLPFVE